MTTAFPGVLDAFTNPSAGSNMSDPAVLHHVQHANLNDAVKAIQALLGVTGSNVAGTLQKRLATLEAGGAAGLTATTFPTDYVFAADLVSGREYGLGVMSANKVVTVATGAVLNGNFNFSLQIDSGTLDYSAFNFQGDAPLAGDTYEFSVVQRTAGKKPIMFCTLAQSISTSATVPGAPTGLTLGAVTSASQALSATAPTSTGGAAILDWVWEYKASSSGTWLVFSDGTSTTPSVTITGLSASTSYDFRAKVANSVGAGAYSATVTGSTSAGSSVTLTRVLGTVPGSPILTATDGAINWAANGNATPIVLEDSKASPPNGLMTVTESNAPTVFVSVVPGFPGYTTDGTDNAFFGGGSSGAARSGRTLIRTVGGGTPGTPTWEQFAIPLPAAACTIDLYVWANLDTGETATVTGSLLDGSATMTPYSVVNGNCQRVTISKSASAATTLNLRTTYSNQIGTGAISAAAVFVH